MGLKATITGVGILASVFKNNYNIINRDEKSYLFATIRLSVFLTSGEAQLHDVLKFKEWQKLPIANRMQLILCSFITHINELCVS